MIHSTTLSIAILFLLALIIEGVLTSVPLSFIVLLTFFILKRETYIFYIAFIAGIILDMLSIRPIGITSSYFLVVLFAVLLYERKFEIQTIIFVALASFFGSLGFLFITQEGSSIVLPAIVAAGLAIIMFKTYESRLEKTSSHRKSFNTFIFLT